MDFLLLKLCFHELLFQDDLLLQVLAILVDELFLVLDHTAEPAYLLSEGLLGVVGLLEGEVGGAQLFFEGEVHGLQGMVLFTKSVKGLFELLIFEFVVLFDGDHVLPELLLLGVLLATHSEYFVDLKVDLLKSMSACLALLEFFWGEGALCPCLSNVLHFINKLYPSKILDG